MSEESTGRAVDGGPENDRRRSFLALTSRFGMTAGLVAAYGTLAAFMGRFLYPARPTERRWQLVTDVASLGEGDSVVYRLPSGSPVNITRTGRAGTSDDFIALSSTCPHLGCQVHWEPQNDRFFCPCHNGVFTPEGVAIAGPPGDAGMTLPRFALKVEKGLLFIEAPLDEVAGGEGRLEAPGGGPPGPGHDPCLYCSERSRSPVERRPPARSGEEGRTA